MLTLRGVLASEGTYGTVSCRGVKSRKGHPTQPGGPEALVAGVNGKEGKAQRTLWGEGAAWTKCGDAGGRDGDSSRQTTIWRAVVTSEF